MRVDRCTYMPVQRFFLQFRRPAARLARRRQRRQEVTAMNDLMNRIQSNLPEFSKGQRLIARYIAEHYDKAAFMTASRLGATVGVSESTRRALCHRAGL